MANSLKKDLPIIGIVSLPFIFLAYIWNSLPEEVPVHWNASGEIDRYGSKTELLLIPFLLPLLTYLIFLVVPKIDPKGKIEKMGNKYQSIKLVITLFMSILALYILYTSYNPSSNPSYLILIVGGMIAMIGNYLKTMKPNYFIGIRTPWTLEHEDVWKDTHVLAGKLWFAGGIVMMICSLIFDMEASVIVCVTITVIISFIPIIYSYTQFKKYGAASVVIVMLLAQSITAQKPQEPIEPFPYNVEEVTFKSSTYDSIVLAGTLTLPEGDGPFPTGILVSGSGPQNRDEEILGHKPFLVIADHLTKAGIAVLRYDDRGIGGSTGEFMKATSYDFADDAKGALNYLRTRKEINSKAIGIIGHSEGGMIAQVVAADDSELGFVISLAGPGIKGSELMLLQNEAVIRKMGFSDSLIHVQKTTLIEAYKTVDDTTLSREELIEKLSIIFDKGPKELYPDAQVPMLARTLSNNWFKEFLRYDPKENLNKITCPFFALNGTEDVQVLCDENLNGFFTHLNNVSPQDFEAKKYKGLNHLFQTCNTCSHLEYGSLEETIAPQVLDDMRDWILKVAQ